MEASDVIEPSRIINLGAPAPAVVVGSTHLKKTDKQTIVEILHGTFGFDGRFREDGLDVVTNSGVRFIFNCDGALCSVKPDYK